MRWIRWSGAPQVIVAQITTSPAQSRKPGVSRHKPTFVGVSSHKPGLTDTNDDGLAVLRPGLRQFESRSLVEPINVATRRSCMIGYSTLLFH